MARKTQFDIPKRSIGISLHPEVWKLVDRKAYGSGSTRNQALELHIMAGFAPKLMPASMKNKWERMLATFEDEAA